jgi:hypothetical protein
MIEWIYHLGFCLLTTLLTSAELKTGLLRPLQVPNSNPPIKLREPQGDFSALILSSHPSLPIAITSHQAEHLLGIRLGPSR